ncbi:MAG: DUF3995 domain-containing protein [Pseudomonadota bacterium]
MLWFVIVTLVALSLLHGAWAARLWWPIGNELALARAVAGFPGVAAMPPPLACAGVALALALVASAATVVALGADAWPPRAVVWAGAAVFLGRGIVGYTAPWHRATPEMPFRRLDARYYSPLCIVLGAGLAAGELA